MTFTHNDTEQVAIDKIKRLLREQKAELSKHAEILEERWEGNILHFGFSLQGQKITGTLTVRDREFELYAKLPLMLRMFEGKIVKAIREQAGEMLK